MHYLLEFVITIYCVISALQVSTHPMGLESFGKSWAKQEHACVENAHWSGQGCECDDGYEFNEHGTCIGRHYNNNNNNNDNDCPPAGESHDCVVHAVWNGRHCRCNGGYKFDEYGQCVPDPDNNNNNNNNNNCM